MSFDVSVLDKIEDVILNLYVQYPPKESWKNPRHKIKNAGLDLWHMGLDGQTGPRFDIRISPSRLPHFAIWLTDISTSIFQKAQLDTHTLFMNRIE